MGEEVMMNVVEKINRVYNRLQDDESKKLFNMRLKYSIDRNTVSLFDSVGEMYDDWFSPQLEERLIALQTKDIVVFGTGYVASITRNLLNHWKQNVVAVCDIHRIGETWNGVQVLSVEDAVKMYPSALFLVASYSYRKEMYEELRKTKLLEEQILIPQYKYLLALRGKQYLDLFSPQKDEIYIDAGTFDGESVVEFAKWAGENHKKTYAFEPMKDMCKKAEEKMRQNHLSNVKVLNYAVWDKQEEIYFESAGAGSCATERGTEAVKTIDIDSVVKDEKVTFIKMDIEGSELRALQGARNTIVNHRPRLAICIYHKPEDVVELGNYILDLVPDYKLFIRHYASNVWETVLYAVP